MTRIGLIGAGGMAGVYADRIADIADVSVVGVASPNSAPEFVNTHVPTATPYPDADSLCGADDVDAVAVLTPTDTHADIVETAARAGLDVICEKPLARTMAGARRIEDVVAETGITFMTAHVIRFFPEFETAKERVDDGGIGNPGVVRIRRGFGFGGDRGWFEAFDRSGGVLLDLAVHDFDFLRWLLGDVERVFTRRTSWTDEGLSEVTLTTLRFESGAIGHVEAEAVEVPTVPFSVEFELAGDEGLIEFDLDDVRSYVQYSDEDVHVPRDPVGHDLPLKRDGYHRQLEHFNECIQSGSQPSVGVGDGLESMRLSLAAIKSADRGKPVSPKEVKV